MSEAIAKENAIIVSMLKLRVIMAQKAFNRIHESRRKLEFDFGKLKYVNAFIPVRFRRQLRRNPGGFVEGEHKIYTLLATSADNGYETHSDAYY
jgi:hypothetical protein